MDTIDFLNPWQRTFPLVREPFAAVASTLGWSTADVLGRFRALQAAGSLSRIGGVFSAQAGGAASLAAMAVPASRLDAVAAQVSQHPGVNHNYARDHALNLWFVMTGRDTATVQSALCRLEADTGLTVLHLPMERPYRIDLGFDLREAPQAPRGRCSITRDAPPVAAADTGLAAAVEAGLPLVERPYEAWADALGCTEAAVRGTLRQWLAGGTLRRFGAIVRHHELGVTANAMTVFDVPDDLVDACGERLAQQAGVTLAYRRARAPGWPYNLYCMVHGVQRDAVRALVDAATVASGLAVWPRAVLFSTRRYKQTGARRFRPLPVEGEERHALA